MRPWQKNDWGPPRFREKPQEQKQAKKTDRAASETGRIMIVL